MGDVHSISLISVLQTSIEEQTHGENFPQRSKTPM